MTSDQAVSRDWTELKKEQRVLPTPSKDVKLADGSEWRVHQLRGTLLQDPRLMQQHRFVLMAVPIMGEDGQLTTGLDQRRENLLGPMKADLARLSRIFDLQSDMAVMAKDKGDIEQYGKLIEKIERTQDRLSKLEKNIADRERESERDRGQADSSALELVIHALRSAYPSLQNVSEDDLRWLVWPDDETFVAATFAVLGLEAVKKKEDEKPPSNV